MEKGPTSREAGDERLRQFIARVLRIGEGPLEDVPENVGNTAFVGDPILAHEVLRNVELFPKDFTGLEGIGRSRFSQNDADWQIRRRLTQSDYAGAAGAQGASRLRALFAEELAAAGSESGSVLAGSLRALIRSFWSSLGASKVDPQPFADGFAALRFVFRRQQVLAVAEIDPASLQRVKNQTLALRAGFRRLVEADPDLASLSRRLDEGATGSPGFDPYDELLMNFSAGSETSFTTICWALTQLARQPQAQERLVHSLEHEAVPAGLVVFVNETLRMHPPIPLLSTRVATAPVEIAGRSFAPGKSIVISIHAVQRHRDFWSMPNRFDPERAEFVENRYDKRAFIPFSAGPRVCGGMMLARLQVIEGVAAILRRYRLSTDERGPIPADYALTLRPLLRDVRFEKRANAVRQPAAEDGADPRGCPAHG